MNAGQYYRREGNDFGLAGISSVSRTAELVTGYIGTNTPAYWQRGVGVSTITPPSGHVGGWNLLATQGGKIAYNSWNNSGSYFAPFLYDPVTAQSEILPIANFSATYVGTKYKDSVGGNLILGYTIISAGGESEIPTIWLKTNGVWTARYLPDSHPNLVYSLDSAGNVFGLSELSLPAIWNTDLVRTMLPLPAGITGGYAAGRLRDGRIVGQVSGASGRFTAIWANETSMPTLEYWNTGGITYEAPALGGTDTYLRTYLPNGATQRECQTWTPTEGHLSLTSQVIGGLAPDQTALFAGDGGHLVVHSSQNGKYYLLTPVPEPTTALLALPTLFLLRRRRVRRT